jgi:hypothetical protein
VSGPRAADDFATIRARMEELRREHSQVVDERWIIRLAAQGNTIIERMARPSMNVGGSRRVQVRRSFRCGHGNPPIEFP